MTAASYWWVTDPKARWETHGHNPRRLLIRKHGTLYEVILLHQPLVYKAWAEQ